MTYYTSTQNLLLIVDSVITLTNSVSILSERLIRLIQSHFEKCIKRLVICSSIELHLYCPYICFCIQLVRDVFSSLYFAIYSVFISPYFIQTLTHTVVKYDFCCCAVELTVVVKCGDQTDQDSAYAPPRKHLML